MKLIFFILEFETILNALEILWEKSVKVGVQDDFIFYFPTLIYYSKTDFLW